MIIPVSHTKHHLFDPFTFFLTCFVCDCHYELLLCVTQRKGSQVLFDFSECITRTNITSIIRVISVRKVRTCADKTSKRPTVVGNGLLFVFVYLFICNYKHGHIKGTKEYWTSNYDHLCPSLCLVALKTAPVHPQL